MITKRFMKNLNSSVKRFTSWNHIPEPPADPILSLNAKFKQEKDPRKVNLTIGAYRTEEGNPWILPSVKAAMSHVNENMDNMEYLPPTGDAEFLHNAWKIAYGEDSDLWQNGHIGGCQTLSGSGGLYMGMNFVKDWWTGNHLQLYTTTPTWPIHDSMSEFLGLEVVKVPYFHEATNSLDIDGLTQAIRDAPDESIFLLHPCAHNPTGIDPSEEQWIQIRDIIQEKGHLTFFDMAYQGFASGCLETDAKAIKLWQDAGLTFVLGQSFAKSMGLYGLRTGAFSVTCSSEEEANLVTSKLGFYCRHTWSSPPLYGAAIAKTLIGNPDYFELWSKDMVTMSGRILEMRQALRTALEKRGSPVNWEHITNQIGMFAFTGIGPEKCEKLLNDYKVYLTMNGRISVAGLNPSNVEYVAECFDAVTRDGLK